MNKRYHRAYFHWLQDWMRVPANKKLLRQWLGVKRISSKIPVAAWDAAGAKAYKLFLDSKRRKPQNPR